MVLFESKDGGILRSGMEIAMISGEKKLFAPPWEVENLLKYFLRWLSRSTAQGVHPFLLAVSCHTIFVQIHPFCNGNGRMARLLMNYVLLRAGYPALIIRTAKKDTIRWGSQSLGRGFNRKSHKVHAWDAWGVICYILLFVGCQGKAWVDQRKRS